MHTAHKVIMKHKKYIIALLIGLVFVFFLPQIILFKNSDLSNYASAISFSGPRQAIGGKILSPYKISFKSFKDILKLGLAPELLLLPKFTVIDEKIGRVVVIISGRVWGICKPGNKMGAEGYWHKGFFVAVKTIACGK